MWKQLRHTNKHILYFSKILSTTHFHKKNKDPAYISSTLHSPNAGRIFHHRLHKEVVLARPPAAAAGPA